MVVAGCAFGVTLLRTTPRPRRTVNPSAARIIVRPGPGVFVANATTAWKPVAAWSSLTGVRPGLVTYYSGWGDPFQSLFADEARHHGAVPLIQMEPRDVSLAAIVDGRYDSYLRTWASAARSYGHPVALSFGPEANGPFYSWGCDHSPATQYIAAWRHIHDVMTAAGARSILWTWDVNRMYYATCPLAARWPGAAYVNWVGVDGYWRGPGDTFASALEPTIRAVRRLSHKPVLIAETGAKRGSAAARWIRSVFAGATRLRLIGVVWFNYGDRLGDYRLQDDPSALSAFRSVARKYAERTRNATGSLISGPSMR